MSLNKSILKRQIEKANEYLDEKKNNKAEKFLTKIILKEPSNSEAMLLLGITKRRLGNLKEAIRYFEKTTDLNKSKEEAWGLLTITYIDQGNIEMAKKTIKKAAQLNPNNQRIQFLSHNLVQTYVKNGPFF